MDAQGQGDRDGARHVHVHGPLQALGEEGGEQRHAGHGTGAARPAVKLDALTDATAKKKAALVAVKVNIDGRDDAYVAARFDAEIERMPAREDARKKLAQTRVSGEGHVDGERTDGRSAYDQLAERQHNRWKTPTATAAKVEG